ncbi:MAG: ribulose-phosphate 3-epimerase [Planctomycetaceae bacterium]
MKSRDDVLALLRTQSPLIAPSMLKCDFGNLHREVEQLESAGAALLHLDVMDGHFVPNLSYGPMVIERLRSLTQTVFDAHLMISDPARYLEAYLHSGCQAITFHIEAVPQPLPLLTEIRRRDRVAGVAINPETPFSSVEPFLSAMDLLLVMSVRPGFGGQKFIPDALTKITAARQSAGRDLLISVDGGIGRSTIAACSEAGCDVFVAGSSIFDEPCYSAAMAELRQLAMERRAVR